jgi:hypothetical protein
MRPNSTLMALGLVALLGTASADADLIALRAHVPFSFEVGGAILPPGDYSFRVDGVESPGVLRVRNESGRGGALILARKAEIPEAGERPKLIFEKDGDQHVLSQVLEPGRYGIHVLNQEPRGEREQVAVLAN